MKKKLIHQVSELLNLVREEIGGGLLLVVTDFVDADEKEDAILLWNEQIKTLKRKLGSS